MTKAKPKAAAKPAQPAKPKPEAVPKPAAKLAVDKAENPKAVTGDNLINEDQQKVIFFNHLKLIKKSNAEVAEIEVELRAAKKSLSALKKMVKSEGTALVDIETALRLEDGDEKVVRGEIENQIKVARWLNIPMGFQFELLEADRRPATDKAFEEGKIAGLKGLAAKPPHDPSVPQYKRWLEGHHEGQAVLSKKFKPLPKTDTPKGSEPKAAPQGTAPAEKPATEVKAPPTPPSPPAGEVNLQQGGKPH